MMVLIFVCLALFSRAEEPFIMTVQNSENASDLLVDPIALLAFGEADEKRINELAPEGEYLQWQNDLRCYNLLDAKNSSHPSCERTMCVKKSLMYIIPTRVFCRKIIASDISTLYYSFPVDMASLFLRSSTINDPSDPENPENIINNYETQ